MNSNGTPVAPALVEFEPRMLRVLIANEIEAHLALLADVLAELGHEVVAQETDVSEVAAATALELPDVAIVGLGDSHQHALAMIAQIVHEAACPVIALLHGADDSYLREAVKRGVFASAFHEEPSELRTAIEIALHRFDDYHKLQQAFGRRASIEQAKGILMSRSNISGETAFARLREHSRTTGTKLVDIAGAVIASHGMLLPTTDPAITPPPEPLPGGPRD